MSPVRHKGLETAAIGLATLAGALLRFYRLGVPSLWLDEILNVDITAAATGRPWWDWLIGFERENGPLYFALQLLSSSIFADSELAARLPAAIIGTITIPLFAIAVRFATRSSLIATVAAVLLAVSPLHVYYSREGRTYALLVFSVALLFFGIAAEDRRSARLALVAAPLIAALTAASAAPLLIVTAIAAVVMTGRGRENGWILLSSTIAALAWGLLLYARFPQPDAVGGLPFDTREVLREVVVSFTLTPRAGPAVPNLAGILTVAAIAGAVTLWTRRQGRHELLITIAVLFGTLFSLAFIRHWFSVRYVLVALPGFLLALAVAIDFLAAPFERLLRGVTRFAPAARLATAGLFTAAIVAAQLPAATTEPYRRARWREIASTLAHHAQKGDTVLASGNWAAVSLRFYLREAGAELDVRDVNESVGLAKFATERRERVWLVSGGYLRDRAIEEWMCDHYTVAFDEMESVRLSYVPDLRDFLTHRSSEEERSRFARAFYEAKRGRLELGPEEKPLLTGSWYEAEERESAAFRWVKGSAAVFVPPARDRRFVRIRATPIAAGQWLTVSLNGTIVGRAGMTLAPNVYSFAIPDNALKHPWNLLELAFDMAVSPAALGGSGDPRLLSAAIEWIELAADDSSEERLSRGLEFVPSRFENGAPVVSRHSPLSAPVPRLRFGSREKLDRLMLRAGLDPAIEGDAVASGAASLHCVLSSALASGCEDDAAFVARLFFVLLERAPDPPGRATYLRMLSDGTSRADVVRRFVVSDELRRRYDITPVE